jgi:hypothetical protein
MPVYVITKLGYDHWRLEAVRAAVSHDRPLPGGFRGPVAPLPRFGMEDAMERLERLGLDSKAYLPDY